MTDPLFKEHTRYFYAGREVPPCTVIAGYGPQPWLAKWAWSQGRQGIPLDAKLQWAGHVGTIVHLLMREALTGLPVDTSFYRPADVALAQKLAGRLKEMVRPDLVIKSEVPCSSRRFGGTPDAVIRVGSDTVLVDFKTGKGVYAEAYMQVSAYAWMLQHRHMELVDGAWKFAEPVKIDKVWILHAPNTGAVVSKIEVEPQVLRKAYRAFLARMASYYADLGLKEVLP